MTLKFFKKKKPDIEIIKEQQNNLKEILPDPAGPLSIAVPSSAIAAANKELSKIYEEIASSERQKGRYINLISRLAVSIKYSTNTKPILQYPEKP